MLEYYTHKYNERFKRNLSNTINYICRVIKNISAAEALLNEVEREIAERSKSPKITKPIFIGEYSKEKIYKLKIRNFYVLYKLNETKKIMLCIDFIYSRCDFDKYKAKY